MSSKVKNLLIVAVLLIVPLVVWAWLRADTVDNHLAAVQRWYRFEANQNRPLDVLMMRLVDRKPEGGAKIKRGETAFLEYHRDALIRLKYLERREFVFTNWTKEEFDSAPGKELRQRVYDRILSEPKDSVATAEFTSSPPHFAVIIYARTADMDAWESLIAELNVAPKKPEI